MVLKGILTLLNRYSCLLASALLISPVFAQQPATPDAPAPQAQAATAPLFAAPDPQNFTADKPSKEEVNAFLHATWGYNPNLAWQTEAIMKTPVQGVSKVIVAIAQKDNPNQKGSLIFFSLPDGSHIISSDEIVPFGSDPFAQNRKVIQSEAAGPARGSSSKNLMFVEFADFQCPHCKDAQPTVDRLVQDFPNARFVFENFPLPQHSEAHKAAAYGVCVQKAGGDAAFYQYAEKVFAGQDKLTPEGSDAALKAVVTEIGLDPAKVSACATSPVAESAIGASMKLANDLNVHETPTLFVNGRGLPIGGLQYDQLKAIVNFQAAEDGVNTAAAK